MALAPRARGTSETGRTSVKSASGKAAQRARNKASGTGTHNGSSGAALKLANYPCVDWDQVEDEVVHVTDISGKVTQSQMGAGGYYTMLIAIPMSYIHNAVDAALASQEGMLYIRMYKAPLSLYVSDVDEDGHGDNTAT